MKPEETKIEINEDLLKQLFYLHIDSLTQFLSYYTRSQQLIEDVIQDVFIKLWEEKDRLNIFHIKTYLFRSARNLMLNNLRDQKNRSLLLERWANELIEDSEAQECINMQMFEKHYQEAINTLPPRCKEIYLLSREQDYTYREISNFLSISEKTVEGQVSIALKKIKEYLLIHYSQKSLIYSVIVSCVLNSFT